MNCIQDSRQPSAPKSRHDPRGLKMDRTDILYVHLIRKIVLSTGKQNHLKWLNITTHLQCDPSIDFVHAINHRTQKQCLFFYAITTKGINARR